MPTWVLLSAALLMGILATGSGLLMLVCPGKLRGLIDRASFANRWSYPVDPPARKLEVQTRLAGLVMAMVGIYFIYVAIHGLAVVALSSHHWYATATSPRSRSFTHSWFDWAIDVAMGAGGLWLVFSPHAFLSWSARTMRPPRQFRLQAIPYLAGLVRVIGAIAFVGAVWAAFQWLR